jgi:hypothetical protein
MKRYQAWVAITVLALGTANPLFAGPGQPKSIPERAQGAQRVVVAKVAATQARYERNDFGDEIIVTYADLEVEESLKGPAGPAVLAVEGGTVDGVTMRVSDIQTLTAGERAVFFMTADGKGKMKPHLRGQGIIKLAPNDTVPGSSLTLGEIRRLTRGNAK